MSVQYTFWYLVSQTPPDSMNKRLKRSKILREWYCYENEEGGYTYMFRYRRAVRPSAVINTVYENAISPTWKEVFYDRKKELENHNYF